MTLEQFEEFGPEEGGINLFYSGTTVSAVNISNINCLGENVTTALSDLNSITVTVGGIEYILNITNGTPKNNYYTFTVTSTDVGAVTDLGCTATTLNPSVVSANFDKSDYAVIEGNVTSNNTTSFIFDVDRSILTSTPVNYLAIMSGSATPASFQELNHTSIGLINSRYEGTKTTRASYGTVPLISVGTFDGALYNRNVPDRSICSQSLQERTIELLAINSQYNLGRLNPDGLPTFTKNTNQFLFNGYISGSSSSPATLDTSTTNITVDWNSRELDKLQVNGLYHFTTELDEEFFILRSYEYVSSKVRETIPFNTYNIIVERGASGVSYAITATNTSDYNINIKKVEADQVFEFDGNKITTVSNRKVYLPLKNEIVVTGNEGLVFSGSIPC